MEKSNSSVPADFYGKVPDVSQVPEANPADVETTESIIVASYECISGPVGKARDWRRMRSLFLPDAHSIRTGLRPDGNIGYKMMKTEDYVAQMEAWLVENGFFEREIHRVVERYGNIAHVFSTYESRHNSDDSTPFMRGINSFQLLYDGRRWWIVNVMWQHESPDFLIPATYL